MAIVVLKDILGAKANTADSHSHLRVTACLEAFFLSRFKGFLVLEFSLGEGPNWISLGVEIKHMFSQFGRDG